MNIPFVKKRAPAPQPIPPDALDAFEQRLATARQEAEAAQRAHEQALAAFQRDVITLAPEDFAARRAALAATEKAAADAAAIVADMERGLAEVALQARVAKVAAAGAALAALDKEARAALDAYLSAARAAWAAAQRLAAIRNEAEAPQATARDLWSNEVAAVFGGPLPRIFTPLPDMSLLRLPGAGPAGELLTPEENNDAAWIQRLVQTSAHRAHHEGVRRGIRIGAAR